MMEELVRKEDQEKRFVISLLFFNLKKIWPKNDLFIINKTCKIDIIQGGFGPKGKVGPKGEQGSNVSKTYHVIN